MNHNDQYTELTAKYLAGEIEPAERQALFAWLKEDPQNKQFFEEMEKIWQLSATAGLPAYHTDMQAAWSKVDGATGRQHDSHALQGKASTNVIPLSKKLRRWHVAATILLTLALGIWWVVSKQDKPQWVEVKTGGKEKREVVLPDSSHVWLNENSALVFDRRFTKRQVTLDGEAYFDVQRLEESPFEILSGDATTTVLGTAFNVRAYPAEDFIEVTVEEGKVALSANREKKSPVILTAGMSGVFNKKEKNAEAAAEKIVNADAWKTGELRFDETPVKEIIQSLERYFGIDIDVTDPLILNCQYTVGFGQPQLPQALEVIAAGLSLHLERSGDRYLLSGEGCQNQ